MNLSAGSGVFCIRAAGFFLSLCVFCCFIFELSGSAWADERITDFSSQVDVQPDGKLVVEETITVTAEGTNIRHGIYRDFPTRYSDGSGRVYHVDFTVVAVMRDGWPEPFYVKNAANGVRIYMGDPDKNVTTGKHTYVLRYVTDRQLGFFQDHDELYWNVTGNGWRFPLDHARVTITIPASGGAGIEKFQMYTGRQGSRGSRARLVQRTDDSITMETTDPLPPGSGFTVVVSWPVGIVAQPGPVQKGAWLLDDFFSSSAAGIGLLVLIGYYLAAWYKVGRDPEAGPIFPVFSPPDNLSPAAGRYIMKMGFDQKSMAAMLVNMAVKGVLRIEQNGDDYVLQLLDPDDKLVTPAERAVRKKLFSNGERVELTRENSILLSSATAALRKRLNTDLLNYYFRANRGMLLPGILISLAVFAVVVQNSDDRAGVVFVSVWTLIWSFGAVALLYRAVAGWRRVFAGGRLKEALQASAFAVPFVGGWLVGTGILYSKVSPAGLTTLLAVLGINLLFAWLLKAPTLEGRKIMDQLAGLRMYMATAEKDRLNMLNPPDRTPDLFERLFPWALALDVEQQWSEQFADVLSSASTEQGRYHPSWYSTSRGFSARGFSSSLGGGLAASIASASVAPGSSSGFSSGGGGGFSGGGGGGGGGGGW
jgi:hypothetical protein